MERDNKQQQEEQEERDENKAESGTNHQQIDR
jgi:hypothetical protein